MADNVIFPTHRQQLVLMFESADQQFTLDARCLCVEFPSKRGQVVFQFEDSDDIHVEEEARGLLSNLKWQDYPDGSGLKDKIEFGEAEFDETGRPTVSVVEESDRNEDLQEIISADCRRLSEANEKNGRQERTIIRLKLDLRDSEKRNEVLVAASEEANTSGELKLRNTEDLGLPDWSTIANAFSIDVTAIGYEAQTALLQHTWSEDTSGEQAKLKVVLDDYLCRLSLKITEIQNMYEIGEAQ